MIAIVEKISNNVLMDKVISSPFTTIGTGSTGFHIWQWMNEMNNEYGGLIVTLVTAAGVIIQTSYVVFKWIRENKKNAQTKK